MYGGKVHIQYSASKVSLIENIIVISVIVMKMIMIT